MFRAGGMVGFLVLRVAGAQARPALSELGEERIVRGLPRVATPVLEQARDVARDDVDLEVDLGPDGDAVEVVLCSVCGMRITLKAACP